MNCSKQCTTSLAFSSIFSSFEFQIKGLKKLLFVISYCWILSAQAQENFLFTHLDTREGLTSSVAQNIQQDAK
jgi:hypothetical protein